MIVADTNTIFYLTVPGEHTSTAAAAFERDPVWAAPLLWRSEFRNAVTIYLRRGLLSLSQAIAASLKAEALLGDREFPVGSADVLTLATGSGCSAYDCEFVALAQELGVRLVTSDREILAKFPSIAVSLESFVR